MIAKLFIIVIASIFVNNFVFSRFLGICPYLGVSKQWSSAMGMGLAVIFVMTMASFITWIIFNFILLPFEKIGAVDVLQTIAFILTIAALVQVVEMIMKKTAPALYKALGIYLPLITTNCAVLGVTLLNIKESYNLIETVVHGFSAGVGFTLALLLMAGIRERLEYAKLPKAVQGFAIAFIIASLMSLSFLGFSGLISE
ncbi:MAG: electron transport complex subunit RsxA [bacterium]|nr:electron transport complex subunit RsxA [bacterium]